ncbi:MAG: GH3 auxin-responsive promoter, partial [Planctomycetota bacterium]
MGRKRRQALADRLLVPDVGEDPVQERELGAFRRRAAQPTSGSSAAIKWIPYTRRFLTELDSALSPWLQDLYANHPGTRSGYHYWSISWLPEDMRAQSAHSLNDDMQLLRERKRWLASQTQAV